MARPPIFSRLNALSEPTRARLLRVLAEEELGVGELARIVQIPQPTVSRHLKLLFNEGWLDKRSAGTANLFQLSDSLEEGAEQLWGLVRDELDHSGSAAEDLRRMEAILALRQVDSQEFFGRHAKDWDALRRQLFGEGYLAPTLLSLLPPGLCVADLGCGTGETLLALAAAGARVIGVDQEQAMLDVAEQRTAGLGSVELRRGGLESLPIADEELDAAFCMLVLHHVEGLAEAFSEFARVLGPGGKLVIVDMVEHDRDEYRRSMGHRHLGFSEAQMASLTDRAGLTLSAWRRLPAEPDALGPGLFVAVAVRPRED